MKNCLKVGDIKKWQGIKNSDTKRTEGGYLWVITQVKDDIIESKGIKIENVSNRYEAIQKYNQINKKYE